MPKNITVKLILGALAFFLGGASSVSADDICAITGTSYVCNVACPEPGVDYWALANAGSIPVDCCEIPSGASTCTPNGGGKASEARAGYDAMLNTANVDAGAGAPIVLEPPIKDAGGLGIGLEGIINNFTNFIFWLGIVICPILIVWGGFNIATAAGSEDKMKKGKDIITYAAIGLVIIAISSAMVTAIQNILK